MLISVPKLNSQIAEQYQILVLVGIEPQRSPIFGDTIYQHLSDAYEAISEKGTSTSRYVILTSYITTNF